MKSISTTYREIDELIGAIQRESAGQFASWSGRIERADFTASAQNLAHYMAVRHRDLRPMQRSLMALGLSSLGRLESRVLPTLKAVKNALAALGGLNREEEVPEEEFFAGERLLSARTVELLGPLRVSRHSAVMVTCPTEAADDSGFMMALAQRRVEALRINCAHDGVDQWSRMIEHARTAEKASGHRFKVVMDLGGPKVRTGEAHAPEGEERIGKGALLAITPCGALPRVDLTDRHFAVECTLSEALAAAKAGDRDINDGKIGARVERVEPWGLVTRIDRVAAKGARLKPEKGLNFPDTELAVSALTEKDLADLDFVAGHADGVGFSFVQSAADVAQLQDELARRRPDNWRTLSLVLKIETARAVCNLPDIVVQAAGRQPTGIMIARGDLAVEIGFGRMAEMQEEILWIGEAAHVPVIWATQVLEHLVQKGTPSRGEMTDAAMSARAECVMLNKGPHLLEALDELDRLLERMEAHQHKKTPQLRRLRSW